LTTNASFMSLEELHVKIVGRLLAAGCDRFQSLLKWKGGFASSPTVVMLPILYLRGCAVLWLFSFLAVQVLPFFLLTLWVGGVRMNDCA